MSFHKGFEDTSYNEISVIVIPDLLMNIVSYHGFAKENNPNVILICRRNLVSYHLSESFVILPQNDESIKSFPREVKYCVSKILIHENYSVITCTTVVLSVANTLKNIYLSNNVFTKFELIFFKKFIFSISSDSTYRRPLRISTILH